MSYERALYSHRFSEAEGRLRQRVWEILCRDFFSRYVSSSDTVLDLAAGDGLFVRNIRARKRIALDTNPDVERSAKEGIEVIRCCAKEIRLHLTQPVDVIFMSNFLEHLPTKTDVLDLLNECRQCLTPRGRLLILQPNIRYVGAAYWDYIDHHIALTERSLAEALEISGYEVLELIPRFLPYTVKSRLGSVLGGLAVAELTTLYLRLPLLWKLFGAQAFAVARARAIPLNERADEKARTHTNEGNKAAASSY